MKIAIAVQRYGKDLVGGAEAHARSIAQRLAQNSGWQVHVYTTTARDYHSWENVYPPGESLDGKVKVMRFASRFKRNRYVFAAYKFLFTRLICQLAGLKAAPVFLRKLAERLESLWFVLQGPYCPDLVRELESQKASYHKVIFFTYLYYPSVFGIPKLKDQAILVPTAHLETPLFFARVKRNFANVPCMLVKSSKEKDLINSICPQLESKMVVAGLGLSLGDGQVKTKAPVKGPYLLFMGRIGKGKGIHALVQYFLGWQAKQDQKQLTLVLAGQLEHDITIPKSPHIVYLGVVSEALKASLLSHCFAVVNPSPKESLSMLVLEGVSAKKPVLINAKDPVLKSYSQAMASVLAFESEADFHRKLDYLHSLEW